MKHNSGFVFWFLSTSLALSPLHLVGWDMAGVMNGLVELKQPPWRLLLGFLLQYHLIN